MKKYKIISIVLILIFVTGFICYKQFTMFYNDKIIAYFELSDEEMKPDHFEGYLETHPEDVGCREAAVVWYQRREKNTDKLQHHIFKLIEYHPSDMFIWSSGMSLAYSNSEFRETCINRMENSLSTIPKRYKGDLYFSLAMYCQAGAIPPHDNTKEGRELFLEGLELPNDAELVEAANDELILKTIQYFNASIDAAIDKRDKLTTKSRTLMLYDFIGELEDIDYECDTGHPSIGIRLLLPLM